MRERSIEEAAAQWLARRDRGLTATEQDDYLEWLRRDRRHFGALAQQEKSFRRMMRLGNWQPVLSATPNPDLFAPRRTGAWNRKIAGLGAAAALLVCVVCWWPGEGAGPAPPENSFLRLNEQQVLPDGSVVELKDGSRITIEFSAGDRRVWLLEGEAHFTVAKDSARPFVVLTGGIAVRAVGTAFNVRLESSAVDVLVTHGHVVLENTGLASHRGRGAEVALEAKSDRAGAARMRADVPLAAGQRALVPLAAGSAEPQVTHVEPRAIKDALAWQGARLQFYETPLAVAAAEFNKRSGAFGRMRLVLADPEVGALRIGGTFRVDNVEGFVRLLEVTLDLRSERRGDNELLLKRAR